MAITYFGSKKLMGTKVDRVSDSLGSSADGSNSGVTLISIKDFAVFDGTNDYITITGQKFNEMMTKGSFSVWINPASISNTGNDIIFDNADGSSSNNGFTIRHSDHSGGKTLVMYGIWGSTDSSITTDSEILEEGWQHLCVTYDGTTGKIYRNGVLQKSGTLTANSSAGSYDARIGWTAQGNNDPKFHGNLYQALVYSEALTQAEITALYNNGTPVTSPSTSGGGLANKLVSKYNLSSDTNDSQGSNNGTNTSVTFSTDNYKLGSGSYSFDGSNDYISFGSASDWKFLHDGTSNTVAFWVKRDGTQASSEPCVIDTQGASASYKGISFYWTNNSAGTLTYSVSDGSGSDTKSVVCGDFTDGQWHHVAVTYDGSNITSYKNGVQNAQTSLSGHTPSTADPSYTLHAGRNTRGSTYYKGDVDDIGIYNRALTTTEITALYNSGTGASVSTLSNKAGLKAHYTMNTEGTKAYTGFTKTDDFSLSSYETQPRGCTLSADGTYFYVIGDQGHSVDQFTMSTPYDLTTISHTRVQALGTNNPRGIYFKEDGTKMFVSYYGGTIKRYSLSTAWNVSTIGSADQSDTFESDSGDYNSVLGLFFKPDGTKFYTVVASDNAIKEYTCGSAWNVDNMSGSDTATRDSLQADPSGLFISSDGLRIWYCDYDTDKVYQWNLSTAWDISTGSIDSTSYSVEANPFGFTMKPDGTKFYIVNDGEDEIQEFTGGKSCINDASATSELEVQTNLLANSTFLQINDTPNYYWKQSDNTWAEDESIPYVWSTNSAKITKRTSSATSGGTQSSFMIAGMREPSSGNTTYADVQKWDGTSWSSGTSKPQATIHASGGGDSNTDHMSAGGYHCCDNAGHNETHEWNGSSWSTSGTLPSAGWGFVGDGNTTTGIMGGNMGYGFGNRCATYNGSSWTNVSDGVGIVGTGTMAGKEASAIHGYQGDCETWDGSAWTTVADLTAGSSGANGGSGGDSSQALFFGGGTLVTDIWNGTTFKAGSNYVSTSAGDKRSCNVDSKGVGLSTWDGGSSAGNGDVFKYSR